VAVCEGMSCGCIPILTDILSFRTITGMGSCGALYEAGNARALEEALMRISRTDREKEREKVISRFREHLSFEAIAARIGEVAESL
jgi:glycosyltransferase involved in cell wall biosynthesis